MHRAIGRAFRGTCRKFQNDCPIAAGEDVRKKKDDDGQKDFVPRKHSWDEAVTLTTGLLIGYQLTHGRRRGIVDQCPSLAAINSAVEVSKPPHQSDTPKPCPFAFTSRVFNQPVFSHGAALRVKRSSTGTIPSAVVPSIDITPFIHDDIQEAELPERSPPTIVEDEDIVFELETVSKNKDSKKVRDNSPFRKPSVLERINNNPAEYGTKYAADLLSVLGAFEFLQMETEAKSSPTTQVAVRSLGRQNISSKIGSSSSKGEPPNPAIELMRKGAELGSCRALYNMGVAYERLNDVNLAKEYYKKAADLGHPLATYNTAVFALKDGHLTEGYALMKMASDFGVPEAEEFLKPSSSVTRNDQISVQCLDGRV